MNSGQNRTAAVVGLGRMGLRHIEVLRDLSFDISGVADLREEARRDVAKEFSLRPDQIFADARKMLARDIPDILIVATTAPGHCPLVCMGAEAGVKMILCEKPMAVSLDECDLMIETCEKAGTVFGVNHQMRYTEQCLLPNRLFTSDTLGGLTSMIVKAGNFGLANNGSHYIEMFGFHTGEPPAQVTAWLSDEAVPNPRGAEFEDAGGQVRIETASGKRFYIDAGVENGHGISTTYLGPNGRIEVDELAGRLQLVARLPEHRDAPTTRYGMPQEEQNLVIDPTSSTGPTKSLLEAMLAGQEIPDGNVGRMAVTVLVAAHVSHEQGHRPVDLSHDTLPRDRKFKWA